MLLDVLYDQLATWAEQHDILARKSDEVPKFQQWVETLKHPPVARIGDPVAVSQALRSAMLQHLRDLRRVAEMFHQQSSPAAGGEVDAAPPGWDDATLLAEMQASRRAEMQAT